MEHGRQRLWAKLQYLDPCPELQDTSSVDWWYNYHDIRTALEWIESRLGDSIDTLSKGHIEQFRRLQAQTKVLRGTALDHAEQVLPFKAKQAETCQEKADNENPSLHPLETAMKQDRAFEQNVSEEDSLQWYELVDLSLDGEALDHDIDLLSECINAESTKTKILLAVKEDLHAKSETLKAQEQSSCLHLQADTVSGQAYDQELSIQHLFIALNNLVDKTNLAEEEPKEPYIYRTYSESMDEFYTQVEQSCSTIWLVQPHPELQRLDKDLLALEASLPRNTAELTRSKHRVKYLESHGIVPAANPSEASLARAQSSIDQQVQQSAAYSSLVQSSSKIIMEISKANKRQAYANEVHSLFTQALASYQDTGLEKVSEAITKEISVQYNRRRELSILRDILRIQFDLLANTHAILQCIGLLGKEHDQRYLWTQSFVSSLKNCLPKPFQPSEPVLTTKATDIHELLSLGRSKLEHDRFGLIHFWIQSLLPLALERSPLSDTYMSDWLRKLESAVNGDASTCLEDLMKAIDHARNEAASDKNHCRLTWILFYNNPGRLANELLQLDK